MVLVVLIDLLKTRIMLDSQHVIAHRKGNSLSATEAFNTEVPLYSHVIWYNYIVVLSNVPVEFIR